MNTKKNISIITAVSDNFVIGKDGLLPWSLPKDWNHFNSSTLNKPIIMGRRTFYEQTDRPLPGRFTIVVTREDKLLDKNGEIMNESIGYLARASSIEDALKLVEHHEQIYIVGGSRIYEESLKYCNELVITHVHAHDVEGDTFLELFPHREDPLRDRNDHYWEVVNEILHLKDDSHKYDFTIKYYKRKEIS